jgi:AraC family transcriptional regulator
MTSLVPQYSALTAHYAPGATFGPRSLSSSELVWILAGSATWTLDLVNGERITHRLEPGSVVLAPVGAIDHYAWSSNAPSVHGYLHFDATGDDEGLVAPRVWSGSATAPVAALCSYLLQLSRRTDDAADRLVASTLRLVLEILAAGPDVTERPSSVVERAVSVVRDWWSRDGVGAVSLDRLAAATGVSTAYLSRSFRADYGRSPAAAIESVRLAGAAIALQRSNETIRAIATSAGFANPYHFSRRFTVAYGTAPGRFRRDPERDPLAPLGDERMLALWSRLGAPIA